MRENHKDVGVLVLTAYNDDPYVMAVLQAGANGYVLKTASPEELIQAVRDVHEGKSVLDPSVAQKLMSHFFTGSKTPVVEQLTGRELEVLSLAAKGFTNKAIGVQLGISDRTVQGHLAHIFDKLQASSRTEAVMRAVSWAGYLRVQERSRKNNLNMAQPPKGPQRFSLPWRGLIWQLFVITILPLAVLTVVIAFGSLSIHQKAMRTLVGERDERAVRTAAAALEEQLKHRQDALRSLSMLAENADPGDLPRIFNQSQTT